MNSAEPLLYVPQPYQNHNGGELAFGPDGYLYLSLGDGGGGGDPEETGQDNTDLLGSVLRLDVSGATGYAVPAGNPFVSGAGLDEVWAYGFRNPWRFSFDTFTGDLWLGDVGQGSWEEIDVVSAAGNYGWDNLEGFVCYEPSAGCDQSGLTSPEFAYDHSSGACSDYRRLRLSWSVYAGTRRLVHLRRLLQRASVGLRRLRWRDQRPAVG